MQEIVPGVFVEDRYQPYNVALVMLEEGALVVDVPPRPSDARRWLREAQEVGGVLHYLLLTDGGTDRLLGAMAFADVRIVAAEQTARFLTALDDKEWQEFLQRAQERYPEEAEAIALLKRRPVALFTDHQLFLQRHTPPLEIEVGAGAARGSTWLFVPDRNLLLAGDTVAIDTPPVIEHTPDSKAWLDALKTLAHRASIEQLVPGRGRVVIPKGELELLREYLRVARRTARSLARRPEGEGMAQATNDLQQTFFPNENRKSEKVQRIRRGLERLVAEIRQASADEPA